MLYEDAEEMVEYLAQALKQTSREATILLYSPGDGSSPAEDDGAGDPPRQHPLPAHDHPALLARRWTPPAEDGRAVRYDNVTELSLWPQFLLSTAKTNFKARI